MNRSRSVAAALFALLATAALTGCAQTVGGHGYADSSVVQERRIRQTDEVIKNLSSQLTETTDITAAYFQHVKFGDETFENSLEISLVGSGAQQKLFSQQRSQYEGETVDILHPAGSHFDYYLVGKKYEAVAETPWVSFPSAVYGPDGEIDVCKYDGFDLVCSLLASLEATTETVDAHSIPMTYKESADGSVYMNRGVSLQSLMDANIINLTAEQMSGEIESEDLKQTVPVHIWINADGSLSRIELNGTVEANTPLEMQMGLEVTGTASDDDVPPPPSALDVTKLSGDDFSEFWTKINELSTS